MGYITLRLVCPYSVKVTWTVSPDTSVYIYELEVSVSDFIYPDLNFLRPSLNLILIVLGQTLIFPSGTLYLLRHLVGWVHHPSPGVRLDSLSEYCSTPDDPRRRYLMEMARPPLIHNRGSTWSSPRSTVLSFCVTFSWRRKEDLVLWNIHPSRVRSLLPLRPSPTLCVTV